MAFTRRGGQTMSTAGLVGQFEGTLFPDGVRWSRLVRPNLSGKWEKDQQGSSVECGEAVTVYYGKAQENLSILLEA